MKNVLAVIAFGVLSTGLLVLVQSCGVLGGPPASVVLGPDSTGVKVMVVWTSPAEGTPDKYRVYFMSLGDSAYRLVAETTAASFVHDPLDTTGHYVVAAVFGDKEYRFQDEQTTVPVASDTVAVAELDASGNAGYGWNRTTGAGRTCSMLQVGNTGLADFYITNFAVGSNRLPYSVASPNKGPSDPAGLVPPSDQWRFNGFTDPLTGEQGPLPVRSSQNYFEYTDVTRVPAIIGCCTQEKYFGLVKITDVDAGVGEARLVSWFQPVAGLRLMMHRSD